MRTKIACLLLATVAAVGVSAQKAKMVQKADASAAVVLPMQKQERPVVAKEAAPAPKPAEMTEECQENISLFGESAKQKNYADALAPWAKAFADCKGAHRAIYTYGVRIVDWQISQEKDAAKREQLIDKLMSVYDEQMLYFGNDPKQPRAYLMGMKALNLLKYRPAETQTAYEWLGECVHNLKGNSQPAFLQQFVTTSFDLYKADNTRAERFIADYLFANDLLEANAANKDLKNAASHAQVDAAMDQLFVRSGVADCEQMDKIYAEQVEHHKADYDFLALTLRLYRQVNCRESDVYFAAAEYAHNIKPTPESAAGCAAMSYKKGDYSRAIDYYNEAAQLNLVENDAESAADCYLKAAHIYSANLNNSVRAREYARKSLEVNPNQGTPYLFIGLLYANAKGIYDTPSLNKTVYWVAVDKFVKAKQMDAELTEKANELIRTYSQYFPTKEEIFFEPDLEDGKPFTVGGWIGETTICR